MSSTAAKKVSPSSSPARKTRAPKVAAQNVSAIPEISPIQNLSLDSAGFRLLKLTNMMSRPFFGQLAKQHDLTLNEWRSIVVLFNRPGSAAQDLSQILGLLPMNISRAVIALRKRGLVEEARDPDNHRRVLLWLTTAGQELFESIAPYAQAKNQSLFGVLTPQELTTLNALLEKLLGRAEYVAQHQEEEAESLMLLDGLKR